jgi:hypothetical protein
MVLVKSDRQNYIKVFFIKSAREGPWRSTDSASAFYRRLGVETAESHGFKSHRTRSFLARNLGGLSANSSDSIYDYCMMSSALPF